MGGLNMLWVATVIERVVLWFPAVFLIRVPVRIQSHVQRISGIAKARVGQGSEQLPVINKQASTHDYLAKRGLEGV